jgi:hypothetical protein
MCRPSGPYGSRLHVVAMEDENVLQTGSDGGFIFNDQDANFTFHHTDKPNSSSPLSFVNLL